MYSSSPPPELSCLGAADVPALKENPPALVPKLNPPDFSAGFEPFYMVSKKRKMDRLTLPPRFAKNPPVLGTGSGAGSDVVLSLEPEKLKTGVDDFVSVVLEPKLKVGFVFLVSLFFSSFAAPKLNIGFFSAFLSSLLLPLSPKLNLEDLVSVLSDVPPKLNDGFGGSDFSVLSTDSDFDTSLTISAFSSDTSPEDSSSLRGLSTQIFPYFLILT